METSDISSMLKAGSDIAARAARAGKTLVQAAHDRLEVVTGRMNDIRAKALGDPALADEYQALALESGQLSKVIGRGE